jgi:peptidoglycan hydrolase CwlO-like protein
MPEDEIAQAEIAALTRRFEEAQAQNVREFGIIKSELTTLQLKVSNVDQKVDSLDQKVGRLTDEVRELNSKIDRNQAQIIELLSNLVGRNTDDN